MKKVKVLKYYYYQIFETNENSSKIFDFANWLDIEYEYNGRKNIALEDCIVNFNKLEKSENRFYIGKLYKLRENLPSKITEGREAEPIPLSKEENIGEGVTFLFDTKLKILMLESHRMAPSLKHISTLISKSTQTHNKLEIKRIFDEDIKNRIKTAKKREFKITFINTNIPPTSKSIGGIMKYAAKANANTMSLTFSLGRGKNKESLNNDEINDWIEEVENNASIIQSASVKIHDDIKSRIETYDLIKNPNNS